jgi:hypothetical protein
MRYSLVLLALTTLSGCHDGQASTTPSFTIEASYQSRVPELLEIKITNKSADYLCLSRDDFDLGGGSIQALPASTPDAFDNRPPPDFLGGLNVRSGLMVVPPQVTRDAYVDLTALAGRKPAVTGLSGTVRVVACRDLFSAARAHSGQQTYSVALNEGREK